MAVSLQKMLLIKILIVSRVCNITLKTNRGDRKINQQKKLHPVGDFVCFTLILSTLVWKTETFKILQAPLILPKSSKSKIQLIHQQKIR